MALKSEIKDILGIKTNVPKVDWFNYKGIMIAPPKFGKTTIASKIPNSVLLAFEKGYDSVALDVREINDWRDFVSFIDLLEENIDNIGDGLRLLVFDTAHKAWEMCTRYTLEKCNREKQKKYARIQNVPYAEGLDRRDEEFAKQLERLDSLDIKWVMFGHTIEKKVNPKDDEPYMVVDHDFEKRLADIIVKDASYILIGENIVLKEENEDGEDVMQASKRQFVAKNDGLNKAGGRVYIGENIEFDTEDEFVEKFPEIFKKMVMEKNNLKETQMKTMVKEEKEEVLESRKKTAQENKDKEELISEVKEKMKSAPQPKVNKTLNYLLEEYNSKSPKILKDLSAEELKVVLKKLD